MMRSVFRRFGLKKPSEMAPSLTYELEKQAEFNAFRCQLFWEPIVGVHIEQCSMNTRAKANGAQSKEPSI